MTDPDPSQLVRLVARLVAQEVRNGPFPPPDGYDAWTDDAVWDLTTDLYDKKGNALASEAAAAAGDDQRHLERRLLRTVHNFLVDQAKGTRTGRMRRRLGNMLGHDRDFVRLDKPAVAVPGWVKAGSRGADGLQWHGDLDDLEDAAWDVPVGNDVVFNSSGPPPQATRLALLEVISAVMDAADGLYLPDQILARVITARFDEFLDTEERDASDFTTGGTADERTPDAVDEYAAIDADDLAEYLWTEMSADERNVIGVLGVDGSPDARRDAVMFAAGCGPAEADALIKSVTAQIRDAAPDQDTATAVVQGLTRRWAELYGPDPTTGPA